MIVENERGSYSLRNISEFIDGEGEGAYSVGLDDTLRSTIDARRRIQDTPTNQRLKADLIENIWAKFGHLPDNI